MTLIMAFLAAENESRQPENLPQAAFGCVPERFLLSVRTKSINENFLHWILRPLFVFVVIQWIFSSRTLAPAHFEFFFSGIVDPLIFIVYKVDFSCQWQVICVYTLNKIMHGRLYIWNFSSRVQFDITLVRCAHLWAIELDTRREIPF